MISEILVVLQSLVVLTTLADADPNFQWNFLHLEQNMVAYVDKETYDETIDPLLVKDAEEWLLFFIYRPGDQDASLEKRAENEIIYKQMQEV